MALLSFQVEKGSKAEDVGLKRGDQILEVNGQSFDRMNHAKALEFLRQTCHLSITVKSNLLGEDAAGRPQWQKGMQKGMSMKYLY